MAQFRGEFQSLHGRSASRRTYTTGLAVAANRLGYKKISKDSTAGLMGGSKADGEGIREDNSSSDLSDVVGKEGFGRDASSAIDGSVLCDAALNVLGEDM